MFYYLITGPKLDIKSVIQMDHQITVPQITRLTRNGRNDKDDVHIISEKEFISVTGRLFEDLDQKTMEIYHPIEILFYRNAKIVNI